MTATPPRPKPPRFGAGHPSSERHVVGSDFLVLRRARALPAAQAGLQRGQIGLAAQTSSGPTTSYQHRGWPSQGSRCPRSPRPTTSPVFGCFFRDHTVIKSLDEWTGVDNITSQGRLPPFGLDLARNQGGPEDLFSGARRRGPPKSSLGEATPSACYSLDLGRLARQLAGDLGPQPPP